MRERITYPVFRHLKWMVFFLPLVSHAKNEIPFNNKGIKPSTGFIENKGQIIDQNNKLNPAVLYLLNTPGMNVQLRRGGFSYDLYRISTIEQRTGAKRSSAEPMSKFEVSRSALPIIGHDSTVVNFHRIDIDLLNSNPNPVIETSSTSSDYLNYFTTGTPSEGVTHVKSFGGITYKDVYPGIDLQFITSDGGVFEYNFLIQPGADIASIQLKLSGPKKIKQFRDGIRFNTSLGDVDETIPLCYYTSNNKQVPVKGRFKRIADQIYGFSVDKVVPGGAVLLIDPIPTRRWGTYFGGTNTDNGTDFTMLPSGDIVLIGRTFSVNNIATSGAYQTTLNGNEDAYLAKFSPNGILLWSTYYGGEQQDQPECCSSDLSGNIYIAGAATSATGMATAGVFQPTYLGLGQNGFLSKFSDDGIRVWGTYTGGDGSGSWDTDVRDCTVDPNGNIFIVGQTTSDMNISTPGAFQFTRNPGNINDGFIQKFNASGQIIWGTYYGGPAQDQLNSCSVDGSNHLFIRGQTSSNSGIASPGAYQTTLKGLTDVYIALFQTDGARIWGSYYGGNGEDYSYYGNGCKITGEGQLVFTGYTNSLSMMSTPGVYQETFQGGSWDGFISKFNLSGSRIWGTYYGGENVDALYGCAINDSGFIYVTGGSSSTSGVASPQGYRSSITGTSDVILAKLDSNGQRIWGTYYGGLSWDTGMAVELDSDGNIYMCGDVFSENNTDNKVFPCSRNQSNNYIATPGSHQMEFGGSVDAFLVKFAECQSPDTALQINGPATLCQNSTGVVFSIAPIPYATDYIWCVTNGLTITSGQHTTSITVNVGSTLGNDTISVYGINSCDNGFPKVIVRTIYPRPAPLIAGPGTTCSGSPITFTTIGGMSNYQWSMSPGSTLIAGGQVTDSSCTVSWNIAGPQWVSLNYTNSNGCSGMVPDQFNLMVVPGIAVGISIASSANSICAGTSVTFNANTTFGGTAPHFQWKVNGMNQGTDDSVFVYIPANNEVIQCILTSSNLICTSNNPATSNSITMVVNPILPVIVTVSPSSNPVCAGALVNFTATPGNGGSAPQYQWKVNGLISGTNSPGYSYVPGNGDAITCTLTSNVLCPTGNPAISNTVTMTVKPILPVGVSIVASSNPFCLGSAVTFTATPVNGGLIPGYQWKVNGINAGTNNPVFVYSPANNDVVTCSMLSSEICTTGNPALANPITMVMNANLPAGITIAASANPFCPGSAVTFIATAINGGSNPAYQWKVNGINAGTNSSSFSYVPTNNDSVRCVINSNLSCVTGNPASSAKIIMIGSLAPSVVFSACFDTVTTVNAKPFQLKGGLPLGGSYSGLGVNSSTGIFTPSVAGIGIKTINYSYINVHDCGASKSKSIVVQPYPSFTCGGNLVDTRDNKVYPTVQIGTQCWMSKNLDFGLTIASTMHQADNCIAEKYCYNGTVANCSQYGGLYQWDELMRFDDTPAGQGLCPPGWHIPTETDWTTLMNSYLGNGRAGRPLQDTIINGFKALRSGVFYLNSSWSFLDFATILWSSTSSGQSKAISHGMNLYNFSVSLYPASRANAFGVRCLRD